MKYLYIIILIGGFLIGACATNFNKNIIRGSEFKYIPGHPELRMMAVGMYDKNNNSFIQVSGDIVYGSLVYTFQHKRPQANIRIFMELFKNSKKDKEVISERLDTVITGNNPNLPYDQDVFSFTRKFDAQPGEYNILLTVTDLRSGKATQRKYSTIVPKISTSEPEITDIQISQKGINKFQTITTYDVPKTEDSLRFSFQVLNKVKDNLKLKFRLLKFKADSLPAHATSSVGYFTSTLAYLGIDYNTSTIIHEVSRIIDKADNILFHFNLKSLPKGNYRFEVYLQSPYSKKVLNFKARDFSIKSSNYPSIKNSSELSEPLIYLMTKNEYKKIKAIKSSTKQKKAVDRFWLKNLKKTNLAQDVIELYYKRVEEANKQFSNFKEGWKTDQGRIYILFGPPYFVEKKLNKMTWYYSHNRNEQELVFLFEKKKRKTSSFPFDHYILKREPYYFDAEYQHIKKWLTGTIITHNL